ncbi:uncharacterized protein LOC127789967 isoform X2 [Diospyros lotus]|uniref:uncharacterized protein LOC127789967 isoform X2 n=1 Tax=Diospyros lotus TaxID=55363 RepID=UPI00225985A5|nr:uncharacterized protein LOC127789967 isoform X2 [Diospyros lotus]
MLAAGGWLSRTFPKLSPIAFPTRLSYRVDFPFSFSTSAAPATKRVGTHDGSFHCDEALGCFMIRLTHKFYGSQIVRSRDPQVLDALDAVLDVGGVYDPSRDRYDHHQKGFGEVFGHGFVTKLSSAGLVYKHYGLEIIAKELHLNEGHPDLHRLHLEVYKNFIEAVDAIDNGTNQFHTDQPPRYVNNTDLSSRLGRLNFDWMDPDQSPERENEAFQHAMQIAGNEFLQAIDFHVKSWLPARSIVKECLAARKDVDPSGEIMVLSRSCPDDRSGNWRVQAVAVSTEKFESRKPLPSPWRGLTDVELSKVAGIPGCTFVHISGFIGGNQSYKGALDMAKTSLTA